LVNLAGSTAGGVLGKVFHWGFNPARTIQSRSHHQDHGVNRLSARRAKQETGYFDRELSRERFGLPEDRLFHFLLPEMRKG
jgi:hypothetical protein